MEINSPAFLLLTRDEQRKFLETLIFASDEPINLKTLYNILIVSYFQADSKSGASAADQITIAEENASKLNFDISYFEELIDEINKELIVTGRPYTIVKIAGAYQFATRKDYGELMQKLYKSKSKKRFSQAALETLAIIAYKQPISKPEIEQIRGVNSNEVVNSLIEKNIVEIKGRKDILGKPLLYGTNDEFLKIFGINSLAELPKLKEIEDIAEMEESSRDDIVISVDSTMSDEIKNIQDTMDIKIDMEMIGEEKAAD